MNEKQKTRAALSGLCSITTDGHRSGKVKNRFIWVADRGDLQARSALPTFCRALLMILLDFTPFYHFNETAMTSCQ